MNKPNLTAVSAQPGNDRAARMDLTRSSPEAAAAISKAVRPSRAMNFDVRKKDTYFSLNQSRIQEISDIQKDRLRENQNILDIFPDILLAEQIIVSGIISPKDLYSTELIYKNRESIIPATIQGQINEVLRDNLNGYYGLRQGLEERLREALFRSGSYASVVLPEAMVDEIINGRSKVAMESLSDMFEHGKPVSVGYLGKAAPYGQQSESRRPALESLFAGSLERNTSGPYIEVVDKDNKIVTSEGLLEIVDNPQFLKMGSLNELVAAQRVKQSIRTPLLGRGRRVSVKVDGAGKRTITNESVKMDYGEFDRLVYKNMQQAPQNFMALPTVRNTKRKSVGRPTQMRLPSESLMPVYPPGDPSNHKGYFAMVDEYGHWVTRKQDESIASGLNGLMGNRNQTPSLTGIMLERAKRSVAENNRDVTIDDMGDIYANIVETQITDMFRNGMYNSPMALGRTKEWDRVMMARALAGKMTRLVFIPAELVTYYAYMYHDNGIGKSYLDQVRILTSMRATLLFGRLMAEIKNSINVTKVTMTLDAEDPTPLKTIEMGVADVLKMRESYFPLGVNSPVDLMEWVNRAGMQFAFTGHPGLPDTKFDFEDGRLNHPPPSSELDDDLRKQTFMAFGLSPEQVDEGFSAQFATTVIHQNALFAKRIEMLSNKTSEHLSHEVKTIAIADAVIAEQIFKIFEGAGDDLTQYLDEYMKGLYAQDQNKFFENLYEMVVENIWVDLPKPDLGSVETKLQAFQLYAQALDAVLPSIISPEVINPEVHGELASSADAIKLFWKHQKLRDWMVENDFMVEVIDLISKDEKGRPMYDILSIMEQHTEMVMLASAKYIEKAKKVKTALQADMPKLDVDPQKIQDASSGMSSGSSDSGFGGTGWMTGDDSTQFDDASVIEETASADDAAGANDQSGGTDAGGNTDATGSDTPAA